MKTRKHTALYKYLDEQGLIPNGSSEAIQKAKADFRRLYKNEWRKAKRLETHTVQVELSNEEHSLVVMVAKYHKVGLASYMKQTSLALIYLIAKRLGIDT